MQVKKSDLGAMHKLVDIQNIIIDEGQSSSSVLYIEGYATFYKDAAGTKQVDRDYEVVNLEGLDISHYIKNPVLLWNHDWSEVRGKVVEIRKDAKGLFVRAEMRRLTNKEADFENVLYGNVKSFSIGFIPYEYEYLEGDVLEITKSELIELSIAPVQSNRGALFEVVGSKAISMDKKRLEELLPKATKKETDMELNNVDVSAKGAEPTQADTNIPAEAVIQADPVVTKPETQIETKVDSAVTPVTETKPEVKVESKPIDFNELANAVLLAQQKADEDKARKAQEAKDAEEAAKLAKEQDLKDKLSYIKTTTEAISAMTIEEFSENAEKFEEFIDAVTDSNEIIMGKVSELIKVVQAGQAS